MQNIKLLKDKKEKKNLDGLGSDDYFLHTTKKAWSLKEIID